MEPFIGQITMFGFNFAPRGWAFCNGQLLPISQNTALFSLIGTYYGGDGRTSMGLPDMQGRAPVHLGNGPGISPRQIGQKGGRNEQILLSSQMPAHNHAASIKVSDKNGSEFAANGNYLAARARDIETTAAIEVYTDQAVFTQNNLSWVIVIITSSTSVMAIVVFFIHINRLIGSFM